MISRLIFPVALFVLFGASNQAQAQQVVFKTLPGFAIAATPLEAEFAAYDQYLDWALALWDDLEQDWDVVELVASDIIFSTPQLTPAGRWRIDFVGYVEFHVSNNPGGGNGDPPGSTGN